MSFEVRLASDTFQAEPGTAAPVAVEVVNSSTEPVTVDITVEGVDPEWVAIPVPSIAVGRGETCTERFFLKPPRGPESLAGTYPFVVRVTDPESGVSRLRQAALEVKTFHHLSIDVQPRRGLVSPFSRQTVFQATVMNLGNVEHTVELSANDQDDLFAFEFESEQLTVSPGAQKTVSLTATAKKPALMANARLQQFSASCRSLANKTVAASGHGQIEQRALITPGILALCALVIAISTSFFLFLPKRPTVDIMTIDRDRLLTTKAFTVKWSTSNAKSVTIVFNDQRYENQAVSGSRAFSIDHPGDFTIEVTAVRGRRASDAKTRSVAVRRPPVVPEPVIEQFSIEPSDLVIGQVFQVNYSLNEAVTKATLSPVGSVLDPRANGIQLIAQVAGEFEYKIIAQNSAGQTVERSQMVRIVRGSKATIVVFRADPPIVDPFVGRVKLTWQLTNALRTEIRYSGRTLVLPEHEKLSGERDFPIFDDTTFTLIGTDVDGVTIQREVTVKVRNPDDMFDPTFPPRN
ncbi:MAG: hypothetical protein IH945_04695 [Armatimonadetes bacterium]|nr:hypothetical protein [Armatimonadota bacterium]